MVVTLWADEPSNGKSYALMFGKQAKYSKQNDIGQLCAETIATSIICGAGRYGWSHQI